MSISTNIDGSVGGANILDLLSTIVSDPKIYEAKLKALQDATAENKKYVELIGPASEIIRIKTDMNEQKEALAIEVAQAKAEAQASIQAAKEEAKAIVDEATKEAEKLVAEAKDDADEAKKRLSEVQSKISDAEKAKANADALAIEYQARTKQLDNAIATAKSEALASEATKAEIIAKHKAFIESL